LAYTTTDGELLKYYRKEWEANEENCLDKVMEDFATRPDESVETLLDLDVEIPEENETVVEE
jgi:hypothetical protein